MDFDSVHGSSLRNDLKEVPTFLMQVRRLMITALATMALFSASTLCHADSAWYSSYTRAKAAAKREGKPLLIMVEHEGCPECARMDVAMANPRAQAALDNAVKVRIEFTEQPDLINAFSVTLTPTMIVYSQSHGGEVYRHVGAMSVSGIVRVGKSIDSLVTAPQPDNNNETPKPKAKAKSSKIYRKVPKSESDDRPTSSSARNR